MQERQSLISLSWHLRPCYWVCLFQSVCPWRGSLQSLPASSLMSQNSVEPTFSQYTSQPPPAMISYRHPGVQHFFQDPGPHSSAARTVVCGWLIAASLPKNCLKGEPKLPPPLGQTKCSDYALKGAKAWPPSPRQHSSAGLSSSKTPHGLYGDLCCSCFIFTFSL